MTLRIVAENPKYGQASRNLLIRSQFDSKRSTFTMLRRFILFDVLRAVVHTSIGKTYS